MSVLKLADAQVHVSQNEVVVDGRTVHVKPKAMAVLEHLIRADGEVVSKGDLLAAIWPNMSVSDSVVTEAIHEIRSALDDEARHPRYIQTIPRRGYRALVDANLSAEQGFVERRPRIAVFSFISLSDHSEDRYFSEGISEELISRLGRFEGIDVLGRMSVVQGNRSDQDFPVLARRLGATHFVTGTLRRARARVRVVAHLVDAASGTNLWSETVERELVDLLQVQSEIAREIRRSISPHLGACADLVSAPRYVPNPEAFKEFAKGRFLWQQDNMNPGRAMRHYQSAITLDPDYAAPHAGMVECFNTLGIFHLASHQAMREASLAHAEQALYLDPESPEVLFAFGYAQFYMRWNWSVAESALRKCLSINPNHVLAYAFLSLLCCPLRRRREALEFSRRAIDLEPFSPLMWFLRGLQFHYFEDFESCREASIQGLEIRPQDVSLLWLRADCEVRFSSQVEARKAVEEFHSVASEAGLFAALAGILFAMLGLEGEANSISERLIEQRGEMDSAYLASLAAIAAGRRGAALDLLEEAERQRDPTLWTIRCAPYFSDLRREPRCRAIIRRLRLPIVSDDSASTSPARGD